ncbi:hypothetical protein HDV00_003501 [Rhizophlyctis rosea]|nr:hypothetical protein HDV00_003501 [Rhizophlyctis rosea]
MRIPPASFFKKHGDSIRRPDSPPKKKGTSSCKWEDDNVEVWKSKRGGKKRLRTPAKPPTPHHPSPHASLFIHPVGADPPHRAKSSHPYEIEPWHSHPLHLRPTHSPPPPLPHTHPPEDLLPATPHAPDARRWLLENFNAGAPVEGLVRDVSDEDFRAGKGWPTMRFEPLVGGVGKDAEGKGDGRKFAGFDKKVFRTPVYVSILPKHAPPRPRHVELPGTGAGHMCTADPSTAVPETEVVDAARTLRFHDHTLLSENLPPRCVTPVPQHGVCEDDVEHGHTSHIAPLCNEDTSHLRPPTHHIKHIPPSPSPKTASPTHLPALHDTLPPPRTPFSQTCAQKSRPQSLPLVPISPPQSHQPPPPPPPPTILPLSLPPLPTHLRTQSRQKPRTQQGKRRQALDILLNSSRTPPPPRSPSPPHLPTLPTPSSNPPPRAATHHKPLKPAAVRFKLKLRLGGDGEVQHGARIGKVSVSEDVSSRVVTPVVRFAAGGREGKF